MIRKCDIKEEKKILDYIGDEYNKCLYLYLDLIKYGFKNPNINIYIQEKNGMILSIALTYYKGMHIFTKDNNCLEEWENIINYIKPTLICGEKSVIMELNKYIKNYEVEYGWVRELSTIENKYDYTSVSKANNNDFDKIAELLFLDDDIGSSYKLNELREQMIERNKEKYSRNYVIKRGKEIVSHAGTGAENEKVAMLNYVITSPKHRGEGLATIVTSKVCNDLISEGKKVYLINYTNESTRLYDKIGFKISCEWGKLYKDLKKEGNTNE